MKGEGVRGWGCERWRQRGWGCEGVRGWGHERWGVRGWGYMYERVEV